MKRSNVEQVLLKVGVPASILGFTYIADTVMMLNDCGEEKPKMTVVYHIIGKKRNTTGSRVERAIRHAFEVARKSGNGEIVERYIGFTHKENSPSLYQMLLVLKQESKILLPLTSKNNTGEESMSAQAVKVQITNNILVSMAQYVDQTVIRILEQVIVSELVRVNMEEITTLPAEYQNDTDRKNQYVIQLFICKKRIKENTKEAYLRAIKRLIVLIDKPLTDMDTTDISHYLNWYERHNTMNGAKKNQATTVNNERRFLSAFFTWLRKEKLIYENPVESTEPLKTISKPIDYFRVEEISKMRDICKNSRERALIEVLRSTGMRVGELIAVELNQIDWTTGDILILGEKSEKYRPVYLDDEARHYYKIYLDSRTDNSDYMFPNSRKPHKMTTTCGIRSVLKTIGKRAGIKTRVYPHKMRKTLGMNLKNKGVDIGTIQEIMGHASPAVTAQYYAQSTPETLRSIRQRAA